MNRIVFDLDDTLIPWKDSNWDSIDDALIELDYDFSLKNLETIKQSVRNYEKHYKVYDTNVMKTYIEKMLNKKLPDRFFEVWFSNLACCVPNKRDYELMKLLDTLSKDYSLYVFTNFFGDSQIGRLKNAGLYPYFEKVISADKHLIKPYSDGFLASCGEFYPEDCLMVGDSFEADIVGAKLIGMNTLLLDSKDKYPKYRGDKIKRIGEIINYL